MKIRTTRTDLVFRRTFTLAHGNNPLPAGRYTLVVDEERLEGLTFSAYRRIAGHLVVEGGAAHPGRTEMIPVTETEVELLLAKDKAAPD